jgi:hypothetical protein
MPVGAGMVYVCMDDDTAATSTALRLSGVLDAASTIVVVLEQASSLGACLRAWSVTAMRLGW